MLASVHHLARQPVRNSRRVVSGVHMPMALSSPSLAVAAAAGCTSLGGDAAFRTRLRLHRKHRGDTTTCSHDIAG